MEKVMVTKEQAEVIRKKIAKFGRQMTLTNHAHGFSDLGDLKREYAWVGESAVLNDLSVDEMARALYIGYEVEETTEEKIRTYFAEALSDCHRNNISLGRVQAIRFVAVALGIKLEEVSE